MPSSRSLWLLALVVLAPLAVPAGSAFASTATEEQQGAALVKALNAGKRTCASLSETDFERVGEYAMGLRFSTVAQHEAMNARMRSMMGSAGEEQAHRAMGRAFTGCGTRDQSNARGYGGMMGGNGAGPVMGGGSGPMMDGPAGINASGRPSGSTTHDGDWSTWAVVVIALLAAALAATLTVLVVRRRPPRPQTPVDA